jgi:hypothetical protein
VEHLGLAGVTATSAPTAIAVLEKIDVTAVLLDYKLEGLDAEAVAFHTTSARASLSAQRPPRK